MRATSKINNANSLYYITKNFNNLMKVSNQIALEQQVVNLEDDPLSANIGIKMLNIISRSEQYNRNIKTGIASLNLSDGFLASAKTVMDSVKSITVGAAQDATATATTRAANAIELNEILKSLVNSGNAYDGSRYIFGGQNTTTPPFTIVNGRYVNYTGNDKATSITVDNNTAMATNVTGTDAFGNMITTVPSRDMNPDVSLATDHSTSLSDLNGGAGVPKGKITVYYSAYPDGLEVDLSQCDTLEDVKDVIERTTLEAARDLDPERHPWLNGQNMDWHDLQDRYVKVTVNPEHNGISLQEFDLGEPLPEPDVFERRKGLTYSGNPGYAGPGDLGIALVEGEETTVHDKENHLYPNKAGFGFPTLRVDDFAGNKVAEGLGIKGSANVYDPNKDPDKILDGFLHGRDLNPVLSDRTLLADLEGYNDSTYTFTNGAKPHDIVIKETTQDSGNVFNAWNLSGLSQGLNTGPNGELYARAVNRGTVNEPEIYVELFTCPVDKATAADRVATGVYNATSTGGTVILEETNDSGLGGTVSIVLPQSIKEATVDLKVDFADSLTASVHVPAFVEESWPNGQDKDFFNIASGWQIRGLDKPPSEGYDENHPATTDLDGDVSVNYRYDPDTNTLHVELSRPAFNDQPAALIATGSIYMGDNNAPPDMANAVSGRVEFVGAPGFEGVKGSVYLEIPSGANFAAAGSNLGTSADDATSLTYRLSEPAQAGTIVFGGATELQGDLAVDPNTPFTLTADTLFKKGQYFANDVPLPGGGVIRAGTTLDRDTLVPKGAVIETDSILAGTILPEGVKITTAGPLAEGTVIPRGSYYEGGPGFPGDGMSMTVTKVDPNTGIQQTLSNDGPLGYDVRATFATVEDFNRAVEEAGIYVTSKVSADGKSLEFQSSLAGAYLTVSEDTDCYEQMNDAYQQLTGLDLNGLIKGVNSDKNGNVYTEVIYYPPDATYPDNKIRLVSDDGEIIEIDPGYYVRVYSDPAELEKSYENRDNTKMVAEGFVPSGKANPDWDRTQPYDPDSTPPNVPYLPANPPMTVGAMDDLILEERNDSGVWGHVDLDYYGDRPQMEVKTVTNPDNTTTTVYDYNPWHNDDITVFPGGLRPEGSRHTTIQEWDMVNITPGVTCDYGGTYHGVIKGDANSNAKNPGDLVGVDVKLYKDPSHTVMTARSDPAEGLVDGKVVLYEVDRYGEFAVDAEGNRIVAGSMTVARNDLLDGQADDFKLTTGANRNYGQEREENVFSTINDIIDALNQNDSEALHNLIGTIQKDIDHILEAAGDVGARVKRMTALSERHADDVVRFTGTLTTRVGMDDQALAMAVLNYQAATNAYQAAMQVSAQIMQMSLLQYI